VSRIRDVISDVERRALVKILGGGKLVGGVSEGEMIVVGWLVVLTGERLSTPKIRISVQDDAPRETLWRIRRAVGERVW
jgi:hypothetical protein